MFLVAKQNWEKRNKKVLGSGLPCSCGCFDQLGDGIVDCRHKHPVDHPLWAWCFIPASECWVWGILPWFGLWWGARKSCGMWMWVVKEQLFTSCFPSLVFAPCLRAACGQTPLWRKSFHNKRCFCGHHCSILAWCYFWIKTGRWEGVLGKAERGVVKNSQLYLACYLQVFQHILYLFRALLPLSPDVAGAAQLLCWDPDISTQAPWKRLTPKNQIWAPLSQHVSSVAEFSYLAWHVTGTHLTSCI